MQKMRRLPIFTRNFVYVTIINLFVFFSFQMIFPTLPLYIKSLGGTDSIIGLVAGTFTVTSLMTRPFAGLALDKIGRRQVFILGLCVLFLTALSYSFAKSVFVIVLIRLLHGFGWGIAGTATSTVAAEIIPHERFGEGMGYFSMANSVSMAIAPAAGLYLAHNYGFNVMFSVSAFLVIFGLSLSFIIRYRNYTPNPLAKQPLYEKTAFGPALMIFFTSMTFGGISSFLPLYAMSRGIPNIGIFFTVYAAAIFISRPLSGRVVDRYSYDVTIIPGLVLIAFAAVMIANAHELSTFLAAGFVYGLGFGTCQMTLQTMVVKNVAQNRLGAANATFFSGVDSGMGVGAILLGSFAELYGYSNMYLISSGLTVVALLIYIFVLRKNYVHQPCTQAVE